MTNLKPELQDIVNSASDIELKVATAINQHYQFIRNIQPRLIELLNNDGAKNLSETEVSQIISALADRYPKSKYFSKNNQDLLDINTIIEGFLRFKPVLLDWEFNDINEYEIFQQYRENIIDMIDRDNFSKFYHKAIVNLKNPEYKIFQDAISGKLYEFIERYVEKKEGSTSCADKARFANKQIIKHFDQNQTAQPLSELYPKDSLQRMNLTPDTNHPTYWSWTSVKDTSELIDIIKQHLMY